MNNLTLALRVKKLRNNKGISQEKLAKDSGLSLRTIQRIESDKTDPRGDTLKRLANALKTDELQLLGLKLKDDQNYLLLLSLSALGFIIFPLLGVLFPLVLWVLKKEKINKVNELGKSILNFQITLFLLLIFYYAYLIFSLFGFSVLGLQPTLSLGIFEMYIPILILYVYNLLLTLINAVRIYNSKSFNYLLVIPFFR